MYFTSGLIEESNVDPELSVTSTLLIGFAKEHFRQFSVQFSTLPAHRLTSVNCLVVSVRSQIVTSKVYSIPVWNKTDTAGNRKAGFLGNSLNDQFKKPNLPTLAGIVKSMLLFPNVTGCGVTDIISEAGIASLLPPKLFSSLLISLIHRTYFIWGLVILPARL